MAYIVMARIIMVQTPDQLKVEDSVVAYNSYGL